MTKFLTILCDGMSDYPDQDGLTPMQRAAKPSMDAMAHAGETGLCRTVPEGMKPGSDVANLAVMGYEPETYYTGRSPLEAEAMGVALSRSDVSYRVNLVTLSEQEPYANKHMLDYSAGEITTEEAAVLIEALRGALPLADAEMYTGLSYRHCLVQHHAEEGAILTPPHDITDKCVGDFLPEGAYSERFRAWMEQSYRLLSAHPVNRDRRKRGLRPANSVWPWGEGRKPALEDFTARNGVRGAVISAVDLVKGIGKCANLTVIQVAGATGNLHTNFDGKAAAAIEALKTHDYLYLHIEAPDECGHQGDAAGKTEAIERIDAKIITPVLAALQKSGEHFRVLVLPDHATPLCLKTHVSDPVPYLLYDSVVPLPSDPPVFSEQSAAKTGILCPSGRRLMERLLTKN